MEGVHGSSSKQNSVLLIQSGHTVLIRLPRGDIRCIKVNKDLLISVPKFGSFHANELIGQPYGLSYEMADKMLTVLPPRTLQEVEDTNATNELINDGEFVQPLTLEEIEALKSTGVHVSEIIKMQIEQHANYSLKTEYSKEKYIKRKEAKYSKSFTTIEPTIFNVCEYWFTKDQNRIRDLRIDALSQMLNLANVRPGGRYIAVDDASGLLVSAVLDRMGGQGRLITVCDADSPPAYPVMGYMNFPDNMVSPVLSSLNWATVQEEYTPILVAPELPDDGLKSEKQKERLLKRKGLANALVALREELFAGEFDALIIASEYESLSILERLCKYLGGSASVVIHSPYLQILAELQSKLKSLPGFLSPNLTEVWLRQYQILPGRTHPMMNMSGSGGFILHTIKIYDDPDATPVPTHRRKNKQRVLVSESEVTDTEMQSEKSVIDVAMGETSCPSPE